MNSTLHKKWTGAGNEKILENLTILAKSGVEIIIRIPLIGGVNDSNENLEQKLLVNLKWISRCKKKFICFPI